MFDEVRKRQWKDIRALRLWNARSGCLKWPSTAAGGKEEEDKWYWQQHFDQADFLVHTSLALVR